MTQPFPLNALSATTSSGSLEERLNRHPDLKRKIESLLSVVENAEGDLVKANEAEQRVIAEIRQLGQTALQEWASRQNQTQQQEFTQQHPQAQRTRKKTLLVQPFRKHRSRRTSVYARQRQGDCSTL